MNLTNTVQVVGAIIVILGLILILVALAIFKITRSKKIGALFAVLLILGGCLIILGFYLVASPRLFG